MAELRDREANTANVGRPGQMESLVLDQLPQTATQRMVGAAHRQIMALHGVAYAPEPFDAHFQDWTLDSLGGGWHRWSPGSNEYEVIPYMPHPFPDERVYIVGECWSNVQGWVQGALNTSEAMLQNSLGLAWPSWLERGGTWLGPGSNPVINAEASR